MSVEFKSYVDKQGYRIVPARRRKFDWNMPIEELEGDRIVGLGGGQIAVSLSQYPRLFREYAKIETPDELLAFITKYGKLTAEKKGDEIPYLLDQVRQMKECLRRPISKIRPTIPMTNLRAWLATEKGRVFVKYGPRQLLDALWLQLGHSLAGGDKWQQCKGCGELFSVGGTSGKRLVAKFHSDECRIKFNSLERSR
jgi:hypothetical protein